ncbi:MAG: Teichoic acids export ATP-binding protein TagH [Deltaproteobacteria bacterium ADurb.Bin135]|nr:MAG: Teichoic acids export ATP-binding protein TagH [Deltaproteobacteria bacterium ADurb.Bin135]
MIAGDTLEEVWALKDVSFEIKRGEAVGIIGRNGAGKSTLLKILSRITEPTTGRVTIKGRVASLLEVGTGFHSELTGRENIYLNGTILGMTRAEIKKKFDEIVAFSEVERYLDTPVKRYSSGMYVRLAFAVAAHLEPEILVVDEVLAVGDAEFQKKCLGKMGDVAQEGRTVLFVSHNMVAVHQLCQSGIVLKQGIVSFLGDIKNTINQYVQDVRTVVAVNLAERPDRQGSQWLKFTNVEFFDTEGNKLRQVISGQDILMRFYYVSDRMMRNATINVAFNVRSSQGYLLTNLNSIDVGKSSMDLYKRGFFQCEWPRFNLRSGSYDCALFCAVNGDIVDWLQSAFTIHVEDGDFFNTGSIINREQGDILCPYDWESYSMNY